MHLAIIPDGNRRWARQRTLRPWKGHEYAVENFRSLTEWCRRDPRVEVLTVWCFSTENWKRDPEEVERLMDIYESYLAKERKGFMERNTRFLHSGRRDRIPSSLASLITEIEAETKNNDGFTLHLAVDYGGKDEIVRTARKIRDIAHPTEDDFRSHVDQPGLPDIDLIVRTSGELRFSNFFLWQGAYAEWVIVDKFFPDFTEEDLEKAVSEFERRKRRFGE